MTTDRIRARNRANAAKSTGPRTGAGKAIVSRNAQRHGATAKPDRSCVVDWLKVILEKSELHVGDVLPSDDLHYAALALAEAEARMVAAEEALNEFERNPPPPSPTVATVQADPELQTLTPPDGVTTPLELKRWRQCLVRAANRIAEHTELGGKRHGLLQRYLAEAQARRRKAFTAWIAVRQASIGLQVHA